MDPKDLGDLLDSLAFVEQPAGQDTLVPLELGRSPETDPAAPCCVTTCPRAFPDEVPFELR